MHGDGGARGERGGSEIAAETTAQSSIDLDPGFARPKASLLALIDKQCRLFARSRLSPMNDVVRDAPPIGTVEPIPLISRIRAVDPKLRLHDICMLAAIFERKTKSRSRREFGVSVPVLYGLRRVAYSGFQRASTALTGKPAAITTAIYRKHVLICRTRSPQDVAARLKIKNSNRERTLNHTARV